MNAEFPIMSPNYPPPPNAGDPEQVADLLDEMRPGFWANPEAVDRLMKSPVFKSLIQSWADQANTAINETLLEIRRLESFRDELSARYARLNALLEVIGVREPIPF